MLTVNPSVDHPERRILNDEVHARPPDAIVTPSAVSYLVRVPPRNAEDVRGHALLTDLLARFGDARPAVETGRFEANLQPFRLRWESHTEYQRYTLTRDLAEGELLDSVPARFLPEDWMQKLQHELLVAVHAWVVPKAQFSDDIRELSKRYFDGNMLIGSKVSDNQGIALTDLRIQGDGFTRLLVLNEGMSETQTGRLLQRLLEIETYRMMSLLALPVARSLTPVLDKDEAELSSIGEALIEAEADQEEQLLNRITRLAAESHNRHQRCDYRFAAADAYYEIVLQRINELRESRIPGLQTFEEFTIRRLTPAVKTYRAVSKRQSSMLQQTARATKLLSTRVDVERQQQNQALMKSMNRRARTQLRLQSTVEGLSVAAMTYYVVGLVGIISDALRPYVALPSKAVVMGVSVPIVAGIAYFGIHRLRREISEES